MNYYTVSKPTIWQRLGFGRAHAERPEELEREEGFAPSWFITETYGHFSFLDRVRILVSGNIHVQCAIKTDQIIEKSKAVSAISVLKPGSLRAS
jgi:hypothetical protein